MKLHKTELMCTIVFLTIELMVRVNSLYLINFCFNTRTYAIIKCDLVHLSNRIFINCGKTNMKGRCGECWVVVGSWVYVELVLGMNEAHLGVAECEAQV